MVMELKSFKFRVSSFEFPVSSSSFEFREIQGNSNGGCPTLALFARVGFHIVILSAAKDLFSVCQTQGPSALQKAPGLRMTMIQGKASDWATSKMLKLETGNSKLETRNLKLET